MERILRGDVRFSCAGFTYLRIASRLCASAPSETSAHTGRRTSLRGLFCMPAMGLPHKSLRHSRGLGPPPYRLPRSEEHTSELQSQSNLVCRLLLEKKKKPLDSQRTISATHHGLLRVPDVDSA